MKPIPFAKSKLSLLLSLPLLIGLVAIARVPTPVKSPPSDLRYWEGKVGELQAGTPVLTAAEDELRPAFLAFLQQNRHGVSSLTSLSLFEFEGAYYLKGMGPGSESIVELEVEGNDLILARIKTTITCSGCGTCSIQQEQGFPCSSCVDPPSCNRTETKEID